MGFSLCIPLDFNYNINQSSDILQTNRREMVKVLTYNIPDYKIKLKIQQLQVMGKKIQGKLITQAMNGTSIAYRCNHQVLWIE